MIRLLVTGRLHGAPVVRMGKSGAPFTTCKMVASSDGGDIWVSVIAFEAMGERIARASDGASLSISGRAQLGIYEGKHGPAVGLSVVADEVITLRARPRMKVDGTADDGDGLDDGGPLP